MKQSTLILLLSLLLFPSCQQYEALDPETAQPFYLASITEGGFFPIRSHLRMMDAQGNIRDYNGVEGFRFWEFTQADGWFSTEEALRHNLSLEVPIETTVPDKELRQMLDHFPEASISVLAEENANACCDRSATGYYALVKREGSEVYDWVFLGGTLEFGEYLSRPEESEYRKLLKLVIEEGFL